MRPVILISSLLFLISGAVFSNDVYMPTSYFDKQTFEIELAASSGETLNAIVTRLQSVESIPFWVEYRVQFERDGAWYAFPSSRALTESWPYLRANNSTPVPASLIDDFADGDFISELGSSWKYKSVNPHTGVWGPISNQLGYQLVVCQNYSHDVVSDTGAVELALNGLDATVHKGLFVVTRGSREKQLRVLLNGIPSAGILQLPGQWQDDRTSDVTAFLLPLSSFRGLDASSLETLTLELVDDRGVSGFFIYEVGLYGELDTLTSSVATGELARIVFEFTSNAAIQSINLKFVDNTGTIYTYSEEISFPLHSETEIRLSTAPWSDKSDSDLPWSATNGDPEDSTFYVRSTNSGNSILVSEHPNVLWLQATQRDSLDQPHAETYKAILYYRDGPPIAIRGANTGRAYPHEPSYPVEIFEDVLSQIMSLGYNALAFWQGYYYSSTDYEQQDYHLAPNTITDNRVPFSPPDDVLGEWLDIAKGQGLITMVGCSINPMVSQAEWGNYHRVKIRASDGFFKLDGESGGYTSYILHMAELAEAHDVDILLIGVELTHLAFDEAEPYWTNLIEQIREVFSGEVTYELLVDEYYHNRINAWPWESDNYGIPFDILDYVGADEYRPYATTNSDTTQEMYDNIMRGFTDSAEGFHHEPAGDITRMTEAYAKPYLVTEIGMMNSDGASASIYHTNHEAPRDDEEARRAWTAYLRAVADLIESGVDYAGLFTWAWPIIADSHYYIPEIWGPIQDADKGIPLLFETIAAYFKDIPLER